MRNACSLRLAKILQLMATSLPFDSISVEVFDKQLRTEFGEIRPRFDIISLPFSREEIKMLLKCVVKNVYQIVSYESINMVKLFIGVQLKQRLHRNGV